MAVHRVSSSARRHDARKFRPAGARGNCRARQLDRRHNSLDRFTVAPIRNALAATLMLAVTDVAANHLCLGFRPARDSEGASDRKPFDFGEKVTRQDFRPIARSSCRYESDSARFGG
jgi:hypothetical protein